MLKDINFLEKDISITKFLTKIEKKCIEFIKDNLIIE